MDLQRKRQINLDAIIKVQKFLVTVKSLIDQKKNFSIFKTAKSHNISHSVATQCVKLGMIRKGEVQGEYTITDKFDTSRTTSKIIIESLRLEKVKKDFSNKKETLIKSGELVDIKNDNFKGVNISDIELKSIVGAKTNAKSKHIDNSNLFSESEKEFDDKLKIACAVASGFFSNQTLINGSIQNLNNNIAIEAIVRTTNDLYSKLKNNK